MRKQAIREHLKFLLRMRSNWDFWVAGSSGVMQGKVKIITRSTELTFNRQQLEQHIERTKENLKRV